MNSRSLVRKLASLQRRVKELQQHATRRDVRLEKRLIDIRERVQHLLEEIRNEERKFVPRARNHAEVPFYQQAQLLDLANDTIIIWNLRETVTYWNQGATRTYGWTKAEAQGRHVHTLLETTFPLPIETIKADFRRDGHWEGELSHRKRDGTRITVASRWTLQRNQRGWPVATMEINQDITTRKQIEEALRESEQRFRTLAQEQEQRLIISDRLVSFGELAASLAHEFNNPLGIISGFAETLLAKTDSSDQIYQPLKIIAEEAQRCSSFVRDILDFARPSKMHLVETDLAAIVRKSIELVAVQLEKAKVEAVLKIDPGLPLVSADPQQVEQILLNLFFNALEAMPQGGVLTVRAEGKRAETNGRAHTSSRSGDAVVISVTDTGTGIEAKDLLNIFRAFFTTKTKGGMGLGLSICESIMKAHGGRIEVGSIPGQGTTFSLYFPVGSMTDEDCS